MANVSLDEISRSMKPIKLAPLGPNPFVSLLTPNYNYAKYIGEAIDSVLAQSYTNFEMIVCDDGSTDHSCEVTESYARRDPRIKLIRKANGGVGSALNAAYRESKGEIVCLLDADDRYLPNKLDVVVQSFQSSSDGGFLGHRMFRIDVDGHRLGITSMLNDPPSGWYGPYIVRYGDAPQGMSFGSGLCLRREVAELVFPLPETFRSYGDGVINALSPLITSLIGVPVPLAEYRYHGQNISNTADVTVESLDRELSAGRRLWELRKSHLAKAHPELSDVFPDFDRRWGTLINTYVQARLRKGESALPSYNRLVKGESFSSFHPLARLFWRLSFLLPRPLFRHAVNEALRPKRVKKVLSWFNTPSAQAVPQQAR